MLRAFSRCFVRCGSCSAFRLLAFFCSVFALLHLGSFSLRVGQEHLPACPAAMDPGPPSGRALACSGSPVSCWESSLEHAGAQLEGGAGFIVTLSTIIIIAICPRDRSHPPPIDPGRFVSAWVYWGGSFCFVYNYNLGVRTTSLGLFRLLRVLHLFLRSPSPTLAPPRCLVRFVGLVVVLVAFSESLLAFEREKCCPFFGWTFFSSGLELPSRSSI